MLACPKRDGRLRNETRREVEEKDESRLVLVLDAKLQRDHDPQQRNRKRANDSFGPIHSSRRSSIFTKSITAVLDVAFDDESSVRSGDGIGERDGHRSASPSSTNR